MNEIVYILNEVPLSFQKEYFDKIPVSLQSNKSQNIIKEVVKYNLIIDLNHHTDINGDIKLKYKAYYEPEYSQNFFNAPKRIGEYLGMGDGQLSTAINNLKKELKKLNII